MDSLIQALNCLVLKHGIPHRTGCCRTRGTRVPLALMSSANTTDGPFQREPNEGSTGVTNNLRGLITQMSVLKMTRPTVFETAARKVSDLCNFCICPFLLPSTAPPPPGPGRGASVEKHNSAASPHPPGGPHGTQRAAHFSPRLSSHALGCAGLYKLVPKKHNF